VYAAVAQNGSEKNNVHAGQQGYHPVQTQGNLSFNKKFLPSISTDVCLCWLLQLLQLLK